MPKKVKYRKQQRGRMKGKAWRGSSLEFGDYGLKTLDAAWITDRQIEAGRVAMTRFVKRGGKIWVRIFPDKPVTKKPAETRMGKGKGAPEYWVAVVKPGRILFEMEGVPESTAREALRLAIRAPLLLTHQLGKLNVAVHVEGGGLTGQAGATRLGIARALAGLDPAHRTALRGGGLLTRDPRMKERKKYGHKGARKRFQWTKR